MKFISGLLIVALSGCSRGRDRLTVSSAVLSVSPSVAQVTLNSSRTFTAEGKSNSGGSLDISPTWSLSPASLGTLSGTSGLQVVFTGRQTGTGTLTATSNDLSFASQISVTINTTGAPADIYKNGLQSTSSFPLSLNIDDGQQKRNWIPGVQSDGSFKMAYPGGLTFGVVFINAGSGASTASAASGLRPNYDYSGATTLSVDMRGESGGEVVEIGIKDFNDPDDGTETKLARTLTSSFQTFSFTLSDFRKAAGGQSDGTYANLSKLYIVIEFVFGNTAATIFFNNVRYQ